MAGHLFYIHSLLFVLCSISLTFFAAAMIGYAIGRRSKEGVGDSSQIGTIQASMLGILGLLLGFTFAVASSRYDARRVLAIDEANALGTTFLRARMLPEPYRTTLSNELQVYINLRARSASLLKSYNPDKIKEARSETEHLQKMIWRYATEMARKHDTPISATFVMSLNESIDLYSTRIATYYARVPNTIMWILVCIGITAIGMVGYGFGLAGRQGWLVMALVSVMVAAVMVMIVDLDRPEAGPTRIDQQTMLDLKNSLAGYE